MAPIDQKKLALWSAVSKTDPKVTKKVKFGREFTAIAPYSQIHAATKQFGPAGTGWGWTVQRIEYTTTNEVAILVRLWHGVADCFIEQWGQAGLYIDSKETKKDGDCFKKATTDGLTKCLSYLGFNADVFMGQFDDNKYVQQMASEFSDKPQEVEPSIPAKEADDLVKTILSDYGTANDIIGLEQIGKKHGDFVRGTLESEFPGMFNTVVLAYKERQKALLKEGE